MTGTTSYVFARNALDLVAARLAEAGTPDDFMAEVDALVNNERHRLARSDTIEPDGNLEVGRESENAQIVFNALGVMDRANAADGRLWTYLAFTTFRSYMEKRWPLDPTKNWKGRVEDRWLMIRTTRQGLVRHGIARLWWIANLTYDAHLDNKLSARTADPFAYSNWVLTNEDRVQAIFEREVGSAPRVLTAAIDTMASVTTRSHSQLAKHFMKELTAASAYRDLEVLEPSALERLLSDLLPLDGVGRTR